VHLPLGDAARLLANRNKTLFPPFPSTFIDRPLDLPNPVWRQPSRYIEPWQVLQKNALFQQIIKNNYAPYGPNPLSLIIFHTLFHFKCSVQKYGAPTSPCISAAVSFRLNVFLGEVGIAVEAVVKN
jgi:hypothetical protein